MKNGHTERASDHFAHLFPSGREWFSPKEAGNIIGRSDQFVRNSFYSGKIFGHLSNGLARRGEEKKTYLRVHRDAIAMYLLETANYTPESFLEELARLVCKCTDYQLLCLEKVIKDKLYPKTAAAALSARRGGMRG